MSSVIRRLIPAVAAVAFTLGAQAQTTPRAVTVSTDLAVNSHYVWRSLTLVDRPVVQPTVNLLVPAGAGTFVAGLFANIEPASYGSDAITQSGGEGPAITEYDPILEYRRTVRSAALTFGATAYLFPNDAGVTSDFDTAEVYAKAAFATRFSPSIALFYDVARVRGAYFEGAVAHSFNLTARAPLLLSLAAGLSAGQGVGDGDNANFSDDGVTHVDLGATMPLQLGSVTISPTVHAIFGQDEFTRISGVGEENDVKVWAGATINLTRTLSSSR